jgi:hypothetical protein
MRELDPFRCKNCNYVFVEPKVYLNRGSKVRICPFCSAREIEEFTLTLDEDDLNLIKSALRTPPPDAREEKLAEVRVKVDDILRLMEAGEFDVRLKKSKEKK